MGHDGDFATGEAEVSSLRHQIPLIIVVMVIILAGCIFYAVKVNHEFTGEMINRYQKEQFSVALQDALRLQEKLIALQSDIAALVGLYEAGDADFAMAGKMLQRVYVRHRDLIECTAFIDESGAVRETEGNSVIPAGLEKSVMFPLSGAKRPDTGGLFSMVRGCDAVAVAAPITLRGRHAGQVAAVVTGSGFFRWFVKTTVIPGSGTILIDRTGMVFYGGKKSMTGKRISELPAMIHGGTTLSHDALFDFETGIIGGPFFKGKDHFVASVPFTVSGERFYLISFAPFDRISEPLRSFSIMLIALVVLATMVVIWGTAHMLAVLCRDMKKTLLFQKKLEREIRERTHAEESTHAAEAIKRALLDAVPDTMFRIRRDGMCLDCHGGGSGFHIKPETVLNRYVYEVMPRDVADRAMESIEKTFMDGTVTVFEYRWTANGNPRFYEARVALAGTDEVLIMARDITERREAETALRESEEKYRTILEEMQESYFETDCGGNLTFCNDATLRMSGYTSEELMGMNNRRYTSPDTAKMMYQVFTELLQDGKPRMITDYEVVTKHGEKKILEISSSLIKDDRGNPVGFRGVGRDITERRRTELALSESEHKYRSLASTVDSMYLVDRECRFLFSNEQYRRRLGIALDEVMGRPYHEFHSGEGTARFQECVAEVFATGNSLLREVESRRDQKYFLQTLSPVKDAKGATIAVTVVSKDITDRKEYEKRLVESLEEKDTLLQEIHHRVKNNLQIVSSLLSLQAHEITDAPMLALFRHSINRVKSMALIHERLYRSKDLSRIDFREYMQTLVNHLAQMYNADPARIQLSVDIADAVFDIETAIPCGLIANELISNALEHAFPGDAKGKINIALSPGDDGGETFAFSVRDTGTGLPDAIDPHKTTTLGLRLVTDLARQLDGKITFERQGGTACTVIFKQMKYRKRI